MSISSSAAGDTHDGGPLISAAKRSQTDCAALTEICCPTIERAKVVNASPGLCRRPSPNWGISLRITRSRFDKCLQASSQHSTALCGLVGTDSGFHPGGPEGRILQHDTLFG